MDTAKTSAAATGQPAAAATGQPAAAGRRRPTLRRPANRQTGKHGHRANATPPAGGLAR